MGEIQDIKEQTLRSAEQQKDAGADRIGGVAEVVHGVARELEGEFPIGASYVHQAASQLEAGATKLRESRIEDLIKGVGNIARTQPAVFFGGAMLAGVLLSRFLKSSSDNRDPSSR
ncbi:hypothetical protein [Pseudaminobacter soli (ex Li et al. 2025)]|uniref:Nutrient deprivation-induced protein n=1 Tax=Pseudaminobacter soli (ex Li et al. 2025) TaxID=1295366 RepID=A0A2P7S1A4_9HYPH|nr:hypothetical protein [Mesorhizobium soli]PSJ56239.1 hypothetical protein C7I85_24985 [Mesorhizobium soli]